MIKLILEEKNILDWEKNGERLRDEMKCWDELCWWITSKWWSWQPIEVNPFLTGKTMKNHFPFDRDFKRQEIKVDHQDTDNCFKRMQ